MVYGGVGILPYIAAGAVPVYLRFAVPRCSQSEDFDYGRLQPSTHSIKSQDESRGWMAQYSQYQP